jgi:uroporphyrinogen decarboxylase
MPPKKASATQKGTVLRQECENRYTVTWNFRPPLSVLCLPPSALEKPMDISPSIYEHAAAVIGRTPWEVSRDEELLFAAHAAAYRLYRHTPIMPGIDIYNLEAEAYGATVTNPAGLGIPAVSRPSCRSAAELLQLKPLNPRRDGRIPMAIRVAARLAREFPETQVRVPVSGPFSIASNLVGFENLLCEVAVGPDEVGRALMHLVAGQIAFAEEIQEHGVDVAFFESAACPPLLSPAMFRRLELPALKAILGGMANVLGHPVPCIIGGNTTPILEAILETGTGYVVAPYETDQEAFLRKIWDRTNVRVRVNSNPERIARGKWPQIRADADRIIRLVAGRPNVCLGTGALPYETPPENVLRLQQYVSRL